MQRRFRASLRSDLQPGSQNLQLFGKLSANPLRYSVDGAPQATEVPACEIQLTIPPGACIELTVEDTEPNTMTRIQGDELSIQYLRRDESRDVHYTYALLAAEGQSDTAEDQSDIVNENEDVEDEL